MARIEGEIVLASDVLWFVNFIIEEHRDEIPPDQLDQARRALLRQQVMGLIDTKVLFADFKRKVPAENHPKIKENLEEPFEEIEIPRLIKILHVADRRELEEALHRYGTTMADQRRQFFERTVAGEWLRQLAPKPQPITHEEMLNYYHQHKQDYEYEAQVRWEELMVQFSRFDNDRAAAWRAITQMGNEVWQQSLQNPQRTGPVFTEIAKERSDGLTAESGGQRDWTTQGALRSAEIDEALFTLDEGQLSDVIETEDGFHIVRVLERKQAGCTPFTEAQAEIRDKLTEASRKTAGQAELDKLRDRSRIWTLFDGEFRGSELSHPAGKSERE